MADGTHDALRHIWTALGGSPDAPSRVAFVGAGDLPSAFPVSDLAGASMAAACLAVADLIEARHGHRRPVVVDRRLASFWFGRSIRPIGWNMAPGWDPLAGDYRTADGWIKLHTNAPHHRAAALEVLGARPERIAVTQAVSRWTADALETAVVDRGGCAAAMRSASAWAAHPQGRAVAAEQLVIREDGEVAAPAAWPGTPGRPLAGLRVLDMTRVLAGPVATRFLAGFGADVLRIDPPGWSEPGVVPDVVLGKRCARLDLTRPDDHATLTSLLGEADVLVHGYRPGALAGLGFDTARRAALRPGLIDVSLDAYGWSGPWQDRRGFDSLVQMSSGIAAAGPRGAGDDAPVSLPVQALDHATGYLMGAAVACALTRRLSTGRGSTIRLSLARTAVLLADLAPGGSAPFAAEGQDDLAAAIERTAWGPSRRLKPPGRIEGAAMRWDMPAAELGSSDAAWAVSPR